MSVEVTSSHKFGFIYRDIKRVLFVILLTRSILLVVMLRNDNVSLIRTGNIR